MNAPAPKIIELDRSLDGARILYRHCMSENPPVDGFVREFSKNSQLVRISRSNRVTDAGTWHRVCHMRVEDVLDPAKAPASLKEGKSE